jgi:hypothetical protein
VLIGDCRGERQKGEGLGPFGTEKSNEGIESGEKFKKMGSMCKTKKIEKKNTKYSRSCCVEAGLL